ncbi:unnamed protein product [Owenia fusiformis]|uniref:Uncharacterized protein n=1 Tax=Owenia fusiformis TaxID=6347 RepID=A0A8J1UDH2_OWEFU|nr:unnamed protein product [Owenia fusiformis]
MTQFRVKKKRTLCVIVVTTCLLGFVVLLSTIKDQTSLNVGSDYDLRYDIDGADIVSDELYQQHNNQFEMNIESGFKHIERKPQAHIERNSNQYNDARNGFRDNTDDANLSEDYTNPDYDMNVKLKKIGEASEEEDDDEDDDDIVAEDDEDDGYYDNTNENAVFKSDDFDMQNYRKFSNMENGVVKMNQEQSQDSIVNDRLLADSLNVKLEKPVQYNKIIPQDLKHSAVKQDSKSRTKCAEGKPCVTIKTTERSHKPIQKHTKALDATEKSRIGLNPQTQIPAQPGVKELPLEAPILNSQKESLQNTLMSPIPERMAPNVNDSNVTVRSNMGIPIVVQGVFWSDDLLQYVPKGPSKQDTETFVKKVQQIHVKDIKPSTWDRCGRDKNKFVILEDGTQLCVRYRAPHSKLVKGEVLSFYLAKWLKLDNVPITVLSTVDNTSPQWRGHNITSLGWQKGEPAALIQYIDNLNILQRSRVKIPDQLLKAYETGSILDSNSSLMTSLRVEELIELIQWTQMIIFDYLTGNYDRVASMQDGAEKENKPKIMHDNMRNLRKNWKTGKLWLIDNESGMFDGYELLYLGDQNSRRFLKFHKEMLESICIFDKHMVTAIEELLKHDQPQIVLESFAQTHDPLYKTVEAKLKINHLAEHFKDRLKEVYNWVKKCQKR